MAKAALLDRITVALVSQRKRRRMSQAELGKKLKRSQTWVTRYERGVKDLTVPEFVQVATVIGADPVRVLRSSLAKS